MRSAGLTHSTLYHDALNKKKGGGGRSFALYKRKTPRTGRGLIGTFAKTLLAVGKSQGKQMIKKVMPLAKETAMKAVGKMMFKKKKPAQAMKEAANETMRGIMKKTNGKKKKKTKKGKKKKKKTTTGGLTPFERQYN